MKAEDIKPSLKVFPTQNQVEDPGITYNEAGVTYNQAGLTYGGIYGGDITESLAKAIEIKPR